MSIIVEDKVVMKPINEIKPYIRNPRRNDKTVELLCKVIPKVGFNVPLVIDKNGVIVKGHARFTAAIRLGMKELPCIITHADEEAIKADRITDNKISEFSEWVNEELAHELDTLDLSLDMTEFGFPAVSFEDMPTMDEFMPEETISPEEKERLYQEFLERQAQEEAKGVEITNEKALQRAKEGQAHEVNAPTKYYKVICEQCGHVMFVREGDALSYE